MRKEKEIKVYVLNEPSEKTLRKTAEVLLQIHLNELEDAIERLNDKDVIHLNSTQTVWIRKTIEQVVYKNKGVKLADIVNETKDALDDNLYKIYKDVSVDVKNEITINWNEEQIDLVVELLSEDLEKYRALWRRA